MFFLFFGLLFFPFVRINLQNLCLIYRGKSNFGIIVSGMHPVIVHDVFQDKRTPQKILRINLRLCRLYKRGIGGDGKFQISPFALFDFDLLLLAFGKRIKPAVCLRNCKMDLFFSAGCHQKFFQILRRWFCRKNPLIVHLFFCLFCF